MRRSSEGIAQIRHSLIDHGEAWSEVARLHFRLLLAEALMKDGQVEEALALLDETLGAALRNGGYYFLAELYRLKGEMLLNRGLGLWDCVLKEAEECFHQSIQVARRQSAKSLELRAVLSLSRLRHRQDKTEEARQTLLEIYNWFTEGFDTEDLKEARALLEELSRESQPMRRKRKTQPATWETVREIALTLPGAVEGRSYGTPAFHVDKKLFVRFHQSGESVVIMIHINEREALMKIDPETFYITNHYLNYPAMLVRLSTVQPDDLRKLITESWRRSAPQKLVAAYNNHT